MHLSALCRRKPFDLMLSSAIFKYFFGGIFCQRFELSLTLLAIAVDFYGVGMLRFLVHSHVQNGVSQVLHGAQNTAAIAYKCIDLLF